MRLLTVYNMAKKTFSLAKETVSDFMRDEGPRLGAALAFYTALSLSPLLIVVVAIAGFVYGDTAARGELAHQIRDLVGEEGANAVQTMLANHTRAGGVIATIVGIVTLVVGASGVFSALQDALDTIWGVKAEDRPSGIIALLRDRLISFSLVCGMAFLLMVSLVFSAVLSGINGYINSWFPDASVWLHLANLLLSFVLTTAMFAMIFKVLPHARPGWSDVWIGATITAALFTAGKFLIGVYLGRAAIGSPYGAAGSFVVLLVWIYYSTQILLFGAEFTQVYAVHRGSGIRVLGREKRARADHEIRQAAAAGG